MGTATTCGRAYTWRHDGPTVQAGDVMGELVGNLLDSLGIEHHPDAGDLVASAIVLLKVIDTDGDVTIRTLSSDGLSWVERIGMLRVAEQVELPRVYEDGA